MNQSVKSVYLGDSVYADNDGWMIRLTTNNGLGASNEIFLEPDVFQALKEYAQTVWGPKREPGDES